MKLSDWIASIATFIISNKIESKLECLVAKTYFNISNTTFTAYVIISNNGNKSELITGVSFQFKDQ